MDRMLDSRTEPDETVPGLEAATKDTTALIAMNVGEGVISQNGQTVTTRQTHPLIYTQSQTTWV